MKRAIIVVLILISFLFIFGCTQTQIDSKPDTNGIDSNNQAVYNNLNTLTKAKTGDTVKVHYTLRDVNENVLETSTNGNPLEFVIDAGQMIVGFNDAVKGMKEGETKTVTLPPEQAYGEKNPSYIVTFDKNEILDFNKIQVGGEYNGGPYNYSIVLEKTDSNMLVDFNHKMAGKILIFEIKLISIN